MSRPRFPLVLALLGLAVLSSCGTSDPTPAPRWYFTCGDPVCRGPQPHPGIPACSAERPGDACPAVGSSCDPTDACNRLIVCATSDPAQQPVGCPISRARFKRDIEYLSQADLARLHDELRGMRLATYRYRAAGPPDRTHLGFIIEDVEPSLAVDRERDMVDLYGYASMAVAALQVQAKQIESLEREVAALRRELAPRSGARSR